MAKKNGAKRWAAWLLFVAVIASGVSYWEYRDAHRPPDAKYKTLKVERRRIAARVTASGTLSALVTVQVGSQVSGRIGKLFADFNSTVKKGELVAKIDPQLFEANVAQAQANYDSSKAALVKAQADAQNAARQYARTKALHDENLAAQADLDTADSNVQTTNALVDVAKANLEQARASLNQAVVNLSYTNITSPIDGIVISRSVDVGQTVAASFSAPVLFTIAQDLRKMQVDTNIAEADVGRLEVGQKAYFTVDAYPVERFFGKISEIRNSATTVQNVVTYDAVILVDNDDLKLRPGMTANVTVVYAERKNALAVPNAALRFRMPSLTSARGSGESRGAGGAGRRSHEGRDGGRNSGGENDDLRTVYRVVGAGVDAEPVLVHLGVTDGTYTEVADVDLHEGDTVATDMLGAGGPSPTVAPVMRRIF